MGFFNPWGLLALLAVPCIILMYLLKQKYKETKVPSLYLWKKAVLATKSQEPWQKLRKNILMFLQIAAAVLLALALGSPYIRSSGQVTDYVLALDCSMSMQATDVEESRFLAAKKDMLRLVESAPPGAVFSVVLLQNEPTLQLSAVADKESVLRSIRRAEVTGESVNWEKAQTILAAEQQALGGEIMFFGDCHGMLGGLSRQEKIYNNEAGNSAVTLLSYTQQEDRLLVLTRIEGWGVAGEEKTVTLYVDGTGYDTKTVVMQEGQAADITFYGVPADAKNLMVRIFPEDALTADDMRYETIAEQNTQRVLLITEGNFFLEKALAVMEGIQLYKATPDNAAGTSGYGLYIYDGYVPEVLPTDGLLLLVNPPAGSLGVVGEKKSISATVRVMENTALSDISSLAFVASEASPLYADWGRPLLRAGTDTLAVYGEYMGRRTAIFGFDFNQSDLPLTAGFPILLYRLLEWYFPYETQGIGAQQTGEALSFSLLPETQSAWVVTPKQERVDIAPPFPATPFSQTAHSGIYTLVEENALGGQSQRTFAVNPAAGAESDLRLLGEAEQQTQENVKTVSMNRTVTNVFLFLVCMLLMIEWWVNCREH